MSEKLTTKDLTALSELMTFENWIALKIFNYSKMVSDTKLKTEFEEMANIHANHHKNLLEFLKSN